MNQNPAFQYVYSDNTAKLRNLLFQGLDPNTVGADGESLLQCASSRGKIAAARLLIAKGADVNHHDSWGFTPLMMSVRHPNIALIRLLLSNGAKVNERAESNMGGNKSALHMACESGNVEVAKLLIEGGAAVNLTDNDKRSPLHYGGIKGLPKLITVLFEHGADASDLDMLGHKPRYYAEGRGSKAIEPFLEYFDRDSSPSIEAIETEAFMRLIAESKDFKHIIDDPLFFVRVGIWKGRDPSKSIFVGLRGANPKVRMASTCLTNPGGATEKGSKIPGVVVGVHSIELTPTQALVDCSTFVNGKCGRGIRLHFKYKKGKWYLAKEKILYVS